MIVQNKGKDLHKIAKSKLVDTNYFVSKKRDGWYTQIYYQDGEVRFFTSGKKEYYIIELAEFIKRHFENDFIIECEFNYDCEGLLGDRGKSAVLTTYQTDWAKGILTEGDQRKDKFRVLDALHLDGWDFVNRTNWVTQHFSLFMDWFYVEEQMLVEDIAMGEAFARRWYEEGYEGAMLKDPDHVYQPGKRVNNIIKLKPRPTADLKCIGWEYGKEGLQWENSVGCLVLQDSEGRICKPGSGLDAWERDPALFDERFLNKIIEIEYERIDQTYVQPIYKRIREDKEVSD